MKQGERSAGHAMALGALCAFAAAGLAPVPAQADQSIEEVVVTGSFIRRAPEDAPSPVQNIDREAITNTGLPGIGDVLKTLTSLSGVENDSDQGQTVSGVGAANVNVRGLGLNTTLVLINGKRSTLAATQANDGSSFVDINQLPPIMIENIEILKDGAAALYGSDAVAGVANFKTRNTFDGFEISAMHQETTQSDDQSDSDFGVIWGFGNDSTHIVLGANYFQRDALYTRDRDFSEYPPPDFTPFFRPSDFPVVAGPAADDLDPLNDLVIDTNCTAAGGFRDASFGGLCYGSFNPTRDIFSEEERKQFMATWTHDINDRHSVYGELGWSETGITALGNSPSLPVQFIIPFTAQNPGALAELAAQGQTPASAGIDQLGFWGVIRNNEENLSNPAGRSEGTNLFESGRFVLGVNGMLTDSWTYDISYNYSDSVFELENQDTVTERLTDALNGFGMCDRNAPGAVAGQGDCQYFNPFANSILAEPGSPLHNSRELVAWMESEILVENKSSLSVIDAIFTTDSLFEMPAGAVGFAVGAQYRESRISSDANELTQSDTGFVFTGKNIPFSGTQDVYALFAELALPLGDTIDMQLAARYEDYGGAIGDTFDPKLAVRWGVTDALTLRSSIGTSFRAPTLFQTSSSTTGLEFISVGGAFGRIPTSGNPDLQPEEAVNFNAGVIWEPTDLVSVILDYWYYDYDDIIVQEDAQSLAADCVAAYTALFPVGTVGGDSLDVPACAYRNILVDPLARAVQTIDRTFQNASKVETDGLDLAVSVDVPTDMGSFAAQLNWAYMLSYDLEPLARPFDPTPGGGAIDAVGRRNYDNFARSLPEHKANLVLSWLSPNATHFAAATTRYVDSIEHEDPAAIAAGLGTLDEQITLDLLYQFNFSPRGDDEATLSVGVVNVTDEDPPAAFLFNGYDSTLHDPRGRLVYGKIRYSL